MRGRIHSSPLWVGSQKRSIRLDEHALKRRHRERTTQLPRVLEGHVAREAQVVTTAHAQLGHLGISRVAMEHCAFGRPVCLENLKDVGVGIAIVNLQDKAQLFGQRDVITKGTLLGVATLRPRVVIVEAGLADDPDAGHPCEARDLGKCIVVIKA